MQKQLSVSFMVMGILFSVCLVLSNILAVKQFDIWGFPSTAGLIIFPVSYIINDCIAEVWGFKKARFIIWVAFAVNFFAILLFQISIALPPADYWQMQEAYSSVLAQTPRISAGKPDGVSLRIVPECLCDEQDEDYAPRKTFRIAGHRLDHCGRTGRHVHIYHRRLSVCHSLAGGCHDYSDRNSPENAVRDYHFAVDNKSGTTGKRTGRSRCVR